MTDGEEQPTLNSAAEISAVWGVEAPPNLMIGPSDAMDIWEVPREVGAIGMRILEQQRPVIWPPTMQAPSGRWIMVTLAMDEPAPSISAQGTRVRRLGSAERVLVPPSRRPGGKLRWVWSQRFPYTPLPEPWPLVCSLAAAAERIQPWEVRDEAPSPSRAASQS